MASINGILPGSKKSVPYMVEASEWVYPESRVRCTEPRTVVFLWKMIELNKVSTRAALESGRLAQEITEISCTYS